MLLYSELYIDQGSDFIVTVNLTDDVTSDVMNLVSYSARSQMRRSYYSENPTANFTCSIVDAANGELTIALTSANTSNIKPGRYVYDVELVNGSVVTRVIEGIVLVTPGVTR